MMRRSVSKVSQVLKAPQTRQFHASSAALHRVSNFNAGPAGLPLNVLETAQKDFTNYEGSGMGIMEMSHRSKEFDSCLVTAEADLRDLLKIPENYKVLFMQGGATTQFAAVPLNLLGGDNKQCEYLVTGGWSKKAAKEAKKYGDVSIAVDTSETKHTSVPDASTWKRNPDAAYLAYCANETVQGVEFPYYPETAPGQVLVADFSSSFCSQPIDVSKFGLIYAGAQKNIGPAGLTMVIVREDLLGKAYPYTPAMLDYGIQASNNSVYNTPPSFSIYMAGLVFKHLKALGGLEAIAEINAAKASTLYAAIDASDFYTSPVDKEVQSKMNVPFRVGKNGGDEEVEKKFIAEATAAGMIGLKGHRSVGGCRASIYNSVSQENIDGLVTFMHDFEKAN